MFKTFLKRRKYRATSFGEVEVKWASGHYTVFSIVFFENDNGKRKYKVAGGDSDRLFTNSSSFAHCETWRHTGLLPIWAKDPLAEKLTRDY